MKMHFDYFEIQKGMLQTEQKNFLKKMVQFVQFPCFLSDLWSFDCKKVYFLQFWADLNKKPKSVKAIYIYGSESSHYTLSENYMIIGF